MNNNMEQRYLVYLKQLLEQFKESMGIKRISIDNLLKDDKKAMMFYNWLDERNNSAESYANMLNLFMNSEEKPFMGSSIFNQRECVEVGKGPRDTIVGKTNNTVISPMALEFARNYARSRFKADFAVYNGKPIIVYNDRVMGIDTSMYNTFMTQNPYSFNDLNGWDELHNSGMGRIIVGVYGKDYDKDKYTKIKNLEKFSNKLNNNNVFDKILLQGNVFGTDNYYAFVYGKKRIKRK